MVACDGTTSSGTTKCLQHCPVVAPVLCTKMGCVAASEYFCSKMLPLLHDVLEERVSAARTAPHIGSEVSKPTDIIMLS